MEPLAALQLVREGDEVRLPVVRGDVQILDMEQLSDALADELVHRRHLELPGERRADLVDDRELGGALFRLREEALCLVEQAGVLQGDAQARRQRCKESLVRLAEGVLLEPLETDDTDDPIAAQDRHAEERLRVGAANLDGALEHRLFVRPDSKRTARRDDQ